MQEKPPMISGWNGTYIAEGLLDHTMQAIARPNNDTLAAWFSLCTMGRLFVVSLYERI